MGETHLYALLTKHGGDWQEVIGDESGYQGYLRYNDIHFRIPGMRNGLLHWALWLHDGLGYDGVRLNAAKPMPGFFPMSGWKAAVSPVGRKSASPSAFRHEMGLCRRIRKASIRHFMVRAEQMHLRRAGPQVV